MVAASPSARVTGVHSLPEWEGPALTVERLPLVRQSTTPISPPAAAAEPPAGSFPWWEQAALQPLGHSTRPLSVDVNSLIVDSLRYSARVKAISDNAIIAETAVIRADAEFDTRAFMESKFVRTSVPTGSTLEAGFNVPRLREENWFHSAGLRKKNTYGGKMEASQRYGLRDSNSNFFFPSNQGNARLTLSYNQPLLNGAGVAYNTSLIVLANLDTRIAADRSAAELQDHLLEVTSTYWKMYLQRATLLQKQRHLERAEFVLTRLEQRREVDALDSQIARARAAVALRRSEIIRAGTAIGNAESTLRALVNSPDLLADRTLELVPMQTPMCNHIPIDLQRAALTALENRPEIDAATQEVEAARVRLGVAKNELWPVLDAVLETYASGLQGNYDIGQSLADQFTTGEPSYTAGLVFEVPLQRRAAKANNVRREAELRQMANRLRATMETTKSEVEIAVREVETAYREMVANRESMLAAQSDTRYWQRRWEELPGDDRAASLLLDDLLDSQDRLVFAENAFVQGQVNYTLSLAQLNRAMGTLIKHERIVLVRSQEQGLPSISFEQDATMPTESAPRQPMQARPAPTRATAPRQPARPAHD